MTHNNVTHTHTHTLTHSFSLSEIQSYPTHKIPFIKLWKPEMPFCHYTVHSFFPHMGTWQCLVSTTILLVPTYINTVSTVQISFIKYWLMCLVNDQNSAITDQLLRNYYVWIRSKPCGYLLSNVKGKPEKVKWYKIC